MGFVSRSRSLHEPRVFSQAADQPEALELPQTATGYAAGMLQGLWLLLIGLAGLAWQRRSARA